MKPEQRHRPAMAGLLVAVATIGAGILWWTIPDSYPFGPGDTVRVSVMHRVEHDLAALMMLVAGTLGLVVALLAGRPRAHRVVAAGAALQAAFLGLVISDASVLSTVGYLLAIAAPVGIVAAVVFACVRGHTVGYVLAVALLALVGVGAATGLLTVRTIGDFVRNVAHGFGGYGPRVAWALAPALGAVVWAAIALRALRRSSAEHAPSWTAPESAARWGRVAAIVAALCPVPYAVARLTWLTPWPIGLAEGFDSPATRVQGALLGVGAALGAVLTLGLISRWGEVFPRWFPVWHGRPVPVPLAVIPGTTVAVATCVAAPGAVLGMAEGGAGQLALGLLLFPFPVWGPLLGAAVLAYWLRRRKPFVPHV